MTAGVVEARLDTVGFSFPIEPEFDTTGCTHTVLGEGTAEEAHRWHRSLPGGGFLGTGVGGMAWVEASLPKRIAEDNVEGLTLSHALEVMRDLYDEAQNYVQPRVEPWTTEPAFTNQPGKTTGERVGFEHCKVKRLDLVRDFDGVAAIGPLLDGLSRVPRRAAHKVRRFADADAGKAETLRVGPKSWAATLYDKYAESQAAGDRRYEAARRAAMKEGRPAPARPAPVCEPGRLRYELRARSELLAGKLLVEAMGRRVERIADMEEQALAAAAETMFRTVGFDREVSGIGAVAARINAADDLTPRTKRELVSYLFGAAAGVKLQWSSNTERRYRELAASLGITLGVGEVEDAFTARLDYEAGGQLVAA